MYWKEYQQFEDEQENAKEQEIELAEDKKQEMVDNQANQIEQQTNKDQSNHILNSQNINVQRPPEDDYESSSGDDEQPLTNNNKFSLRSWRKDNMSLQQKLFDLEEDKKSSLRWAIRYRSCCRIFSLLFITFVLMMGFWMIFEFFAYYEGIRKLTSNSRLQLNVTNCRIHIIDKEFQEQKHISTIKYLEASFSQLKQKKVYTHNQISNTSLNNSEIQDMNDYAQRMSQPDYSIEYSVPGRFNIDPNQNTSKVEEFISENNYSYEFNNIFSPQSCQIDINVYQKAIIDDLSINCFGQCYIIMTSTNISYNTINIVGEFVELNAVQLITKNITLNSIQGRFQINYIQFEQLANIKLDSGDIIVQSSHELMVNWTHANPHYCFSSPFIANPIVIGCQEASTDEVQSYLEDVGIKEKRKKQKLGKEDEEDENNDDEDNDTNVSDENNVENNESNPTDENNEENNESNPTAENNEGNKENYEENSSGEENLKNEDSEAHQGEQDLLKVGEKYEKFYQDEHENLQGNIILIPQLQTYNNSKQFSQKLDYITHQEEAQESNQKQPNDYKSKNKNKKQKANMQSKTEEKKEAAAIQFQPSCFGNAIFCQTAECKTINKSLEDSKRETISYRLLQKDEDNNKNELNRKKQNQSKIDYKSLQNEAADKLPQVLNAGLRFLNVTGRFGNLYVNIIKKQNSTVSQKSTVMNGVSYSGDGIDFDLPSQKLIKSYLKMTNDPHNFDPNFIFQIGSKITRSDNYQQLQLTYNPAYSYIRPWWIGTFSLTLMSTVSWNLELNLSPGFCPYRPSLNLNDIYNTKYLVSKYFNMAEHGIITTAWQHSINFPKENYEKRMTGFRKYIESNDEFEDWVQIIKLNETNYQIHLVNLDKSLSTQWAVYISLLISIWTAFFLMLGVLYIINSVYKQIFNQIEATNKYSKIEKTDNKGDVDKPAINLINQQNNQNIKSDKLRDIKNDKEIIVNFNFGRLFYQLYAFAPPLSAFIDYLCVLVSKKYINSAEEFYAHLLQKKSYQKFYSEINDQSTESISATELKTLYEKFCFLNGYLEQKLDDERNLKLLRLKGFQILVKENVQTEAYIKIKFNGQMPKLSSIPEEQSPFQQFIINCCQQTEFDEDTIVVENFNRQYQEFCTINHLNYEIPSESELIEKYKITNKYIPQKFIERIEVNDIKKDDEDDSYLQKISQWIVKCLQICLPQKQVYVINRQKVQNHYYLILNNPQQIKTTSELKEANDHLILFGGWWIVDFFTVIAHFLTILVLIIPLFSFTILEKILYSQYSLIPIQHLITLEDIFQNYWIVPLKLYNESTWIQNILILAGIYWVYSIIDLLYYYISMEFPQENFFRKVQPHQTNSIQKLFRQIMWTLVLYSAYQFCVVITLALVWLLLGAIVNPTVFLPYATASATFITVLTTKAAQFKEIASDGFETIIAYVQKIAKEQMANLVARTNLKAKIHNVIDSDEFKNLAGSAANFGLVDQTTLDHIQGKMDDILDNPEKALQVAQDADEQLQEISLNPNAFANKLVKNLEEKAIQLLKEQMQKHIEGYGLELANITLALLKKDKNMFINNINLLAQSIKQQIGIDCNALEQPILSLIWEFAYPSNQIKEINFECYLQSLMLPCAEFLSQIVSQKFSSLNPDPIHLEKQNLYIHLHLDNQVLTQVITKSISLIKQITQQDQLKSLDEFQIFFHDLIDLLKILKEDQMFENVQELVQYSGLFKMAFSLFQGRKSNKIQFHEIFEIISGFFDEIDQFQNIKNLLSLIQFIMNSFKKQQKPLQTKFVKSIVMSSLNELKKMIELKEIDQTSRKIIENGSFITMIFNFIQHHFENIPKDFLNEIFQFIFNTYSSDDCVKLISQLVNSEQEFNKFITIISELFEFLELFMEDTEELIQTLYLQSNAFSIDQQKGLLLQEIMAIKYQSFIITEGQKHLVIMFETLQQNCLIQNFATALRVNTKVLLGIIFLVQKFYANNFLKDLFEIISKIKKVELEKVKLFFQILILFRSNNAQEIAYAISQLSIPKEYLQLVLISKQILDVKYADFQNLQKLGASKQILRLINKKNFQFQIWFSKFTNEILQQDKNSFEGGNSKGLKAFLLTTIIDQNFVTTFENVSQILLDLGNNENQLAMMNSYEIELLVHILLLKNININSHEKFFQNETKNCFSNLAKLININEHLFEDFLNTIFLFNPPKIIKALQNLQLNKQTQNQEIIPKQLSKECENFIDFLNSKMDLIRRKNHIIKHKIKSLFPMITIPNQLIEKILLNPQIQLDQNSYYQLAELVIGKYKQGIIPQQYVDQLKKPIAFMTGILNSNTENLKQIFDNENLTIGQITLIQMLNENTKSNSLTIFLNYLKQNSKKNKKDNLHHLPEIFHVFACLYLFFTGQYQDLKISQQERVSNKQIQLTIPQYLSQKLDIHIEFFQSLHSFFLDDNQKFTQIMINFMRRQQACKFALENKGNNLPLQSLVKIPDQFILNFINLITNQTYQTSFFSKELQLDSSLVELISTLTKIKNSTTKEQRNSLYQNLSTQKLGTFLEKVGVKGEELTLLLQIIFLDYGQNYESIISGLKLDNKLQASNLKNFLMIDNIRADEDPEMLDQFNQNQIIMKMKIAPSIVVLAKRLCKGQYSNLEKYMNDLQHFSYPKVEGRSEYFGLLQGIIGCINCVVPNEFNAKRFLQNLQNLLKNSEGKVIPKELEETSNSLEFAMYKLVQIIKIDPNILMLNLGIVEAWKFLQESYMNTYNKENKWLNPVLVLYSIITIQSIPTLIKEILGDIEWQNQVQNLYQQAQQLLPDLVEYKFDDLNLLSEQKKKSEKLIQQLFSEIVDSREELKDMINICQFNPKIIQILDIGDYDLKNAQLEVLADTIEIYSHQQIDLQQILLELANIIRNIKPQFSQYNKMSYEEAVKILNQEPELQKVLFELKPQILFFQIKIVFQKITELFEFPKITTNQNIFSEQLLFDQVSVAQIPLFTFGVCNSLATLRNSFWNQRNNQLLIQEDHCKITTYQIDYMLSGIERNFFFKNFIDCFSKIRATCLVGLSCGHLISVENLITANCTRNLISQKKSQWLQKESNFEKRFIKKCNIVKKILQKRWQINGDFTNSRYLKCYIFDKLLKYDVDIYNDPENYIQFSAQKIDSIENYGLNWKDYFFDIGYPSNQFQLINQFKFKKQIINVNQDAEREIYILGFNNDSKLETIIDAKSGFDWKKVLKSQQIWSQTCYQNNENFKLLIEIWKGNYTSITKPDSFFYENEPTATSAYFGLAALSGAFLKVENGWQQNSSQQIQSYITACCSNILSDYKTLNEILSVFMKSFQGFKILAQFFKQDQALVDSFVKLSFNLHGDEQERAEDQQFIINKLNLSQSNSEVLNNLIDAYIGKMDVYQSLADYSTIVNPNIKIQFDGIIQVNTLIKRKNRQRNDQNIEEIFENQKKILLDKQFQDIDQTKPEAMQVQGNQMLSVKNIISKLLQSFDKTKIHSVKQIDPQKFDFSKFSDLSSDPEKSQESFILLLWQLSQVLTSETLPTNLKIPDLFENKTVQNSFQEEEQNNTLQTVRQIIKFLTLLVQDDYSFFFQTDALETLQQLGFISGNENELSFFKGIIGLNSSKMMIIQAKLSRLDQKTINQQYQLNLNEQVKSLIDSKIIQLSGGESFDTELSKDIALLFLSITNGSIHQIYQAIQPHHNLNAGFIFSIFIWKNYIQIFSNDNIKVSNQIMSSLYLIPLLIYNQVYNFQDNKNRKNKIKKQEINELIINSFQYIFQQQNNIDLQWIKQIQSQKRQKFYWSQWIFYAPKVNKYSHDLKNKLKLFNQCNFFYQIMTGNFFVEKINKVPIIEAILRLYMNSNRLINYPDTLQMKQGIDWKWVIPKIITTQIPRLSQSYRQNISHLEIFEQLIQLLIIIQIPIETLNLVGKQLGQFSEKSQNEKRQQFNQEQKIDETTEIILDVIKVIILKSLEVNNLNQRNKQFNKQSISNTQEFQQAENNSIELKKLVNGILILITGHNILNYEEKIDNEIRNQILCYILDSVFFNNLKIIQILNTRNIKQFLAQVQLIYEQPIKSITNEEFLKSIQCLLEILTNQKSYKKPNEQKIVSEKSNQWNFQQVDKIQQIIILQLPMEMIKCIFGLASYKLEYIPKLLSELKVPEKTIQLIDKLIKQVQEAGVFQGKYKIPVHSQQEIAKQKEIQEIMKKIQEGTANNIDLFKAIDEDGTKSISKEEYTTLSKRLGMNLSEHRINEIFANIKRTHQQNNQNTLNEKEFDQSMKYLQQKNTDMALDFLGISPALLTLVLIQGAIILLLIFIFIFLGIQAFALGGTFGAIVNSIIPMIAGSGASVQAKKISDSKQDQEQIGESVQKTQKIIQNDTI